MVANDEGWRALPAGSVHFGLLLLITLVSGRQWRGRMVRSVVVVVVRLRRLRRWRGWMAGEGVMAMAKGRGTCTMYQR
ncbi:hypothetical protein GGF50DRAFT_101980 [Schizophyllum commune]